MCMAGQRDCGVRDEHSPTCGAALAVPCLPSCRASHPEARTAEEAGGCVGRGRSETKFAIGSGAKTVCVCYYEPENNWWISKHIKKKHASSVTDVAWHPNSLLLATASTDCRCRIYSAFVKGVDDPVRPVPSS